MYLRLRPQKLAIQLGLLMLVLHLHLIIITCVLVNRHFLLGSKNVVLRLLLSFGFRSGCHTCTSQTGRPLSSFGPRNPSEGCSVGSIPTDCTCGNTRQTGDYNRGADRDSAATGTGSPSKHSWVWKISATLACPSRVRE